MRRLVAEEVGEPRGAGETGQGQGEESEVVALQLVALGLMDSPIRLQSRNLWGSRFPGAELWMLLQAASQMLHPPQHPQSQSGNE